MSDARFRDRVASAVSDRLMRRTGAWAMGIEYSLALVEREGSFLVNRGKYSGSTCSQCPPFCQEPSHLARLFPARFRYELRDVVADTATGQLLVPWVGSMALVQESTAWPAYQVGGTRLPDIQKLPRLSQVTTVLSPTRNYFHWLTEDLPTLMRVVNDPHIEQVLLRNDAPRFVLEAAQVLGVAASEIPRFVRLDHAVLYGKTQDVGWMNPDDVEQVRAFANCVQGYLSDHPRGLFIGRRGYSRAHGEELALEGALKKVGISPFDPGAYSLRDQILHFRATSVVVGLHGAGLTGLAFSRPGTTLIELVRPDYSNRCYEWLCHAFHLNYQPAYGSADACAYAEANCR